jgi:hypothetical protein
MTCFGALGASGFAAGSVVAFAAGAAGLRAGSEGLAGAGVGVFAFAGASTFALFVSLALGSGAGEETAALTGPPRDGPAAVGLRAVVVFRAAVLGVALLGI